MIFRKAELAFSKSSKEPKPLGVEVDPKKAALWDEFVKGRNLDDIYYLWKDPDVTDPTIRQRAVTVLTAPEDIDLPFGHTDQGIGRFLAIEEEGTQEYANSIGRKNSSLRVKLADRPELAEEVARGVLYWVEKTGGQARADTIDRRSTYVRTILELLPIVDESTADELFVHYPFNDIQSFSNFESESGYGPLRSLLSDSKVADKYKELGLRTWFEIADKEERGIIHPREEHEGAIKNMIEFVRTYTHGSKEKSNFYSAIIAFLERYYPTDDRYVHSYEIAQVADLITEEETRFNFVRRHIAVDQEKDILNDDVFKVKDAKDRILIEWVREYIHKQGPSEINTLANDEAPGSTVNIAEKDDASKESLQQFDAKAETLLRQYETSRQERLSQNALKQAAEQAIQARMRE